MISKHKREDYDTVVRSPKRSSTKSPVPDRPLKIKSIAPVFDPGINREGINAFSLESQTTSLKRGHAFSFAALFLFTVILYTRPAEFYPSPWTNYLALIVGIGTLVLCATTQMLYDGTITTRPRELNLVLLFMLTALLSIPLAINPAIAWGEFSATYIRGILIFIVIINVVRTERRLQLMLLLSVATAIALSVGAIDDYRLGLLSIEGYRAAGHGTGIFGNTNDMALYLVTMLPISIALFFGSRRLPVKIAYGACAAVIAAAIVLSYSRGAFLGMLVVFVFFSLRLARGSKLAVTLLLIAIATAAIVLAPNGYGTRLLSILVPGLDTAGSADSRRDELIRSAYVALRHPLFGIGMGNYQPLMSLKGLVTHNSYTQVAAEMGVTALVLYTMFIVSPLRKLAAMARETFSARKTSPFYYLALGLQGSLLAYMVSSFFLSVAYSWYVYYLVGYAVCFRLMYEAQTGRPVVIEKRSKKNTKDRMPVIETEQQPATA